MKKTLKKLRPAILILYVLLFTTGTSSISSMACQPERISAKYDSKSTTIIAVKKVPGRAMNPLQALTAKFF